MDWTLIAIGVLAGFAIVYLITRRGGG